MKEVEVAVLSSSLLILSSPYGLCGRKATLNPLKKSLTAQELCESRGGRHGLNSLYGHCGNKTTLN